MVHQILNLDTNYEQFIRLILNHIQPNIYKEVNNPKKFRNYEAMYYGPVSSMGSTFLSGFKYGYFYRILKHGLSPCIDRTLVVVIYKIYNRKDYLFEVQ